MTFRFVAVFFVVLTIVGAIIFHHDPDSSLALGALFLGSFCLSFVVTIVPHELGHALAALVLGLRLFTINIGSSGRVRRIWRILGYDVAIYSVVLGGDVLSTPKSLRWARLRLSICALAGPLAHVLLIVGALALLDKLSRQDVLFWVLTAFLYSCVFQLALGLFPKMTANKDRLIPNDGLLLLRIPRMSRKAMETWHSTTHFLEVLEAVERGNLAAAESWLAKGCQAYPDNSWSRFARARILVRQKRHREARECYLEALPSLATSPQTQSAVHCNIAWLDLVIGDPALLDEADRFSLMALEFDPRTPAVKGTRGSVLIELGRADEGISLVRQALRECFEAEQRAAGACYLAIAMARRGDPRQARAFINEAKRLDPDFVLLERAERELERGRV